MQASFVLTVAESKRLIAKGVAKLPQVEQALDQGIVAVAKGTTNSYIVEELLGQRMDKTAYVTGRTLPARDETAASRFASQPAPDVVLVNGQMRAGVTVIETVKEMKAGDVFIKGANALHPSRKLAGILIGDPTGGTIGAVLGSIIAKKITLVIPVGLEKLVSGDLSETAQRLSAPEQEKANGIPSLWPVEGTIITEIEALEILAGVKAYQLAAGGVGGAEGSVRLVVEGTLQQVNAAVELVDTIHGEPPFLSR